jgi:hypothetical protein
MTKISGFVLLACISIMALGCADQPMYQWGHYEQSVYRMYHSKEFSPSNEIVILKKDIEKARQSKKQIGPGVQAHLGYLYTLEGDTVAATAAFEDEIASFPQSKVMIERFLRKMP